MVLGDACERLIRPPKGLRRLVLLETLRDFNIPQVTANGLPVFLDGIWDSFLLAEGPRKSDVNLEQMVPSSVAELCLRPKGRLDTEAPAMSAARYHSPLLCEDAKLHHWSPVL